MAAWPASVLIVGSTAQQPPGVWSSWSGAVASSAVQTLSVSTSPPPPPAPQWTEDSGHQHPPPLTSEKRSERDGQSDNLKRKSSGSSWSILRWRNPRSIRRGRTGRLSSYCSALPQSDVSDAEFLPVLHSK